MGHSLVLLLGIAAIAAPMGFMVGGSNTPVVGIALPAIFGLIVTAIGVFRPAPVTIEQLKLLANADRYGELADYLKDVKAAHGRLPLNIGLSLLVFGLVYTAGTVVGIKLRADGMFAKPRPVATSFPWEAHETPPVSIKSALEWIKLRDVLAAEGYQPEQIKQLYEIQVAEWRTQAAERERQQKIAAATKQSGGSSLKDDVSARPSLADVFGQNGDRPVLLPRLPGVSPFESRPLNEVLKDLYLTPDRDASESEPFHERSQELQWGTE